MILQLGIVLIPQALMATGVLLYITKANRRGEDAPIDQAIEQKIGSLEAIET